MSLRPVKVKVVGFYGKGWLSGQILQSGCNYSKSWPDCFQSSR